MSRMRPDLPSIHHFFECSDRRPDFGRETQDFVLAALVFKEKIEVARLLCTEDGEKRLKALLRSDYTAARGFLKRSFGGIAVPLCYLLSDGDLVHSNPDYVRKIFLVVVKNLDFFRTYNDVLEVFQDPGFQNIHDDRSRFTPENKFDAMIPIANLGYHILSLLDDFSQRDEFVLCMQNTARIITAFLNGDSTDDANADSWRRRLTASLKRLEAVVDPLKSIVQGQVTTNRASDRKEHRYDFEEFRTMQTFATEAEMKSCAPKIQTSEEVFSDISCLSNDYVSSYIGYHFRLLREEMIMSYRTAVQHFARNLPSSERHKFDFRDNGCKGSCAVFWNVNVEEMCVDSFKGVCFRLRFDQTFGHARDSERERAWNSGPGQQMLQHFSHVCIIFDIPESLDESDSCNAQSTSSDWKIVMATVSIGRDQLHKGMNECSSLEVSPVSQADRDELIHRLAQTSEKKGRKQSTAAMLQVIGHFTTGSECVIKCLQKASWTNLPWAKRIAATNFNSERTSDPSHKPFSCVNASHVSSATAFDLSFLIRDETSPQNRSGERKLLEHVNISDPSEVVRLLETLRDSIILDKGQIEPFAFGLSQEVSLIQGSPGCQKSDFIVQIAKAVISNSSESKGALWKYNRTQGVFRDCEEEDALALCPILIVSNTNDAVDSILETMISMNVVRQKEVLRLGRQSKSELLQDQTLQGFWNRFWNGLPREDQKSFKRDKVKQKRRFTNLGEEVKEAKDKLKGTVQRNFWTWAKTNEADLARRLRQWAVGKSLFLSDKTIGDVLNLYLDDSTPEPEREARKVLVEKAVARCKKEAEEQLKNLANNYSVAFQDLQSSRNIQSLQAVRSVKVIGCTTIGAALSSNAEILRALGPRVIIFQEANEVPEAHVLSALNSRTAQIILVGDYLQLRPIVREHTLKREAGHGYDLDVSMFERLANTGCFPVKELTVQRRMHSDISKLAGFSYPRIEDSEDIGDYPEAARGLNKTLFFLDPTMEEDRQKGSGFGSNLPSNESEWKFAVGLARYMVQQGYEPGRVIVLTSSLAQVVCIMKEMRSRNVPAEFHRKTEREIANNDAVSGCITDNMWRNGGMDPIVRAETATNSITLSTVGQLTGFEGDVVIVSTAPNGSGIGYFESDNLVNMMLTRAKYGLIILGSAEKMRNVNDGKLIKKVVNHLSSNSLIGPSLPLRCEQHGNVTYAGVYEEIPENGGCHKICGFQKECGHACKEICHGPAVGISHDATDCAECQPNVSHADFGDDEW